MRIVYMGTPAFAVPALAAIADEFDVAAVYTRPDSVSGRGATLVPSPVRTSAESLGIPVRTPLTLREPEELNALRELRPDVVVVAAYGMILPPEALEVPALGCINIHASLLPRWRGAAPVQRAILAGDAVTGVTIMRMEAGLDTGPYCMQASIDIGSMDTQALTDELSSLGAQMIVPALTALAEGRAQWTEQDESLVTYASKIQKSDTALDPSLTVEEAVRRVRASSPAAPSRLRVGDGLVTVLTVEATLERNLAPGEAACTKRELLLGACDGTIAVTRLKPDGRAAMAADAWVCGVKNRTALSWGAAT